MKTAVVTPYREAPDPVFVRGIMAAAGADVLIASIPKGVYFPTIEGVKVGYVNHVNPPSFPTSVEKVRYFHDQLNVPLAVAAQKILSPEDRLLFLHDDIDPSVIFKPLLERLNRFSFAAAKPRLMSIIGEDPVILEHSPECVAWRAGAFFKYASVPYPEDYEITGPSMEFIMELMEKDKEPFVWTELSLY